MLVGVQGTRYKLQGTRYKVHYLCSMSLHIPHLTSQAPKLGVSGVRKNRQKILNLTAGASFGPET